MVQSTTTLEFATLKMVRNTNYFVFLEDSYVFMEKAGEAAPFSAWFYFLFSIECEGNRWKFTFIFKIQTDLPSIFSNERSS